MARLNQGCWMEISIVNHTAWCSSDVPVQNPAGGGGESRWREQSVEEKQYDSQCGSTAVYIPERQKERLYPRSLWNGIISCPVSRIGEGGHCWVQTMVQPSAPPHTRHPGLPKQTLLGRGVGRITPEWWSIKQTHTSIDTTLYGSIETKCCLDMVNGDNNVLITHI